MKPGNLPPFIFLLLLVFISAHSKAQEIIVKPNIKTVRFHVYNEQLSMPVLNLQSNESLELHFDDLDADVKYYYYTFQLCDIDWNPLNLSQFDYIKGYTQMRLNTYRVSSVALTRYTHYQAVIPDRNMMPTRSGNYLLKVFLDGDTSKLAFTRRMLVLDNRATVAAQIVQPFAPALFRTHQKLQFSVNIKGINTFSANREIKVVVLQNNRWDNAISNIPPTFIRGESLDYSTDERAVFPAGKEWRWLDLRDFRLQSDRVQSAEYGKSSTDILIRPDVARSAERYVYYRDLNGMYLVETTQGLNPYWQSDYATVNFRYSPPFNKPIAGRDLYLFGQLTDYKLNDSLKMKFDDVTGFYDTKLYLKQGYYNYTFLSVNPRNPADRMELDGNYFETENSYTILVYYKSFAARADELIGIARITSRTDRPGFSF